MAFLVCSNCENISNGETTVRTLLTEANTLRKEGNFADWNKMTQSLNRYSQASAILKANNSHAECVTRIDNEYTSLYKRMQGSRA
jgi:hypothetical protein